jgi:hypothetical protein
MPAVLQGFVLFLVGCVVIYGLVNSLSAKQDGGDSHGGGHGHGHH